MIKIGLILMALLLNGCAGVVQSVQYKDPEITQGTKLLDFAPKLDGDKITVAVYSFNDKTGQRKPNDKFSSLSSAVTQGAEVWVIKALQEVGGGSWFKVVERVAIDNLVKERQLIRSTREQYEGKSAKNLKPMLFAGIIIEGAIVSYDSNLESGGAGARYLGIGSSTEYRTDQVVVSMRMISVQTGEVLLTVAAEKTIASVKSGTTFFKFLDMGTKALELEAGSAVNEPTNYAVRAAIDAAVVELINQGEKKKLWKFKSTGETKQQPTQPTTEVKENEQNKQ
jgi:curli production assembly/transport component CsgG